jgi:hypothetical protein
MDHRRNGWFWALALVAVAACTPASSEDELPTCAPFCSSGSPAQTGDSGAGQTMGTGGTGGTGGMSTASFDAGKPSGGPNTGGMTGGGGDAGIVMVVDAGLHPLADSGAADAGADAAPIGDGGAPPGMKPGAGSMLPATTDYAKPGPFKTTTQANVGPNNNYTIYRPDPLGQDGFVHSPIIFGPGILTDAGFYSAFLTHLASHGFVTICVNSMSGGPGDPNNLKDMTMGLDWLIMQNSQAGVFQGKLAVDRAIGMGYSIGATASVELSSHKAIANTVVIHGHNTKGDPHGPVLMMTGTNDVIDDMRKTLSTLEEAPAVLVALPIGHLDVLDELAMLTTITAKARYIAPITAWLRYWINGDEAAKSFFWGDGCTMCKSPWITPEPNAKWKAQML